MCLSMYNVYIALRLHGFFTASYIQLHTNVYMHMCRCDCILGMMLCRFYHCEPHNAQAAADSTIINTLSICTYCIH